MLVAMEAVLVEGLQVEEIMEVKEELEVAAAMGAVPEEEVEEAMELEAVMEEEVEEAMEVLGVDVHTSELKNDPAIS